MPNPAPVLGLDPGSRATGYGLVAPGPGGRGLTLVAAGTIRSNPKAPLAHRLLEIHRGVAEMIYRFQPEQVAVEGLFHAKNAKSALVLGQARGVTLLAAAQAGLEVFEYSPASVKMALVGNGRAAKEQVRAMVKRLLGQEPPGGLDASDALALAITHLHSRHLKTQGM